MYKVHSGVPIPVSLKTSNNRAAIYPFKDMKIGDSFFVPYTIEIKCPKRVRARIASAAGYYRSSQCVKDKYICAETELGIGVRCWRIS